VQDLSGAAWPHNTHVEHAGGAACPTTLTLNMKVKTLKKVMKPTENAKSMQNCKCAWRAAR